MIELNALNPILIDAWRMGTMPWRWWWRSRERRKGTVPIAVLFYHRVADDDLNPWTIRRRDFNRHLEWLQSNFDIVSLSEVQARMDSGFNDRPTVSITFDDGYADNSNYALPLLVKRQIPVTYFVTTNHAFGGLPFDHDVQRGRPLVPHAPQTLKAIADAGVEIGGHTRRHANLGTMVNPEQLFDEVITATRELEALVEQPIRYFAFPFGQVENLNSVVFRLAKQHGFQGVCSAYGGWNEIGDDPFHLQRMHGDPEISRLKNWLTGDPRKRFVWQTRKANEMIREGMREIPAELSAAKQSTACSAQ